MMPPMRLTREIPEPRLQPSGSIIRCISSGSPSASLHSFIQTLLCHLKQTLVSSAVDVSSWCSSHWFRSKVDQQIILLIIWRLTNSRITVTSAVCSFFAIVSTLYRLFVRRGRFWADDVSRLLGLSGNPLINSNVTGLGIFLYDNATRTGGWRLYAPIPIP